MRNSNIVFTVITLFTLIGFSACRQERPIVPPTSTEVTDSWQGDVKGFYLLNEGNMGSNKATLDYFDYSKGSYFKNIYGERNPEVVKELGDVGNDLKIYGEKLYAVINCSNLVEVMDRRTAKHLSQISIPNCRYITFSGAYAYVSSYAGPVEVVPTKRQGYVAKIDTSTLKVVATCNVGYQPEEMVAHNGKLYVANSGGYTPGDYDNRVMVIDLNSFEVEDEIEVTDNLHRIELDSKGMIWVSSRGDYNNTKSAIYIIDSKSNSVVDKLDLSAGNMTMQGDSIYLLGVQWNSTGLDQEGGVGYKIIDINKREVVNSSFISDGTQTNIDLPYCVAVNPINGDILVGDAKDYVTPGKLHCYSKKGKLKWSVTTGDIPSAIAFTNAPLK